MLKILAIDDDVKLCTMLKDYLSGHEIQLESRHSGPQGLEEAITSQTYDLVLLDVMLPGMDGFEVLRNIRLHSTVPVLLLTARGEDVDRIVGLEIGADDYLPKPFNPRELVARIRAILRRGRSIGNQAADANRFSTGNVRFDLTARTVSIAAQPVDLTDMEYMLFLALVRNSDKITSREELAEKALDRDLHIFDRSVDMNVSRLRKKLDAVSGFSGVIRTIRHAGYMYTPERDGDLSGEDRS
jgi:two-component system response regulator CpxR